MQPSDRGSATVLFITAVLPLFFMLLVVAVDLEHFFGLREEVQRVLDNEARTGVQRTISSDALSSRVRTRLDSASAYLSIHDIALTRSAQAGEIVARGVYRGLFSTLVDSVFGRDAVGIPFEISSKVRRAHTSVVLVLDRTVSGGSDPCNEPTFLNRATLTGRLARALFDGGATDVRIAVTPGVREPVEILLAADGADLIPRCSSSGERLPFNVGAVAGVADSSMTDPATIAYAASQMLLLTRADPPIERRALIMITSAQVPQTSTVSETFALLDREAGRQSLSLSAVGIAIGGAEGVDAFSVKAGLESGRAKYLSLSDGQVASADLTFAVATDIMGRTVIAR